jgi:hypothetical protein
MNSERDLAAWVVPVFWLILAAAFTAALLALAD